MLHEASFVFRDCSVILEASPLFGWVEGGNRETKTRSCCQREAQHAKTLDPRLRPSVRVPHATRCTQRMDKRG